MWRASRRLWSNVTPLRAAMLAYRSARAISSGSQKPIPRPETAVTNGFRFWRTAGLSNPAVGTKSAAIFTAANAGCRASEGKAWMFSHPSSCGNASLFWIWLPLVRSSNICAAIRRREPIPSASTLLSRCFAAAASRLLVATAPVIIFILRDEINPLASAQKKVSSGHSHKRL